MKMITRQVTVTGMISTEQGTSVSTLRTRLISIFKGKGIVSFTYDGETISGVMNALNITEVPSPGGTLSNLSVTFSVLYGILSGT